MKFKKLIQFSKLYLCFLIALTASDFVFAADLLDLKTAIQETGQNSPQIQKAESVYVEAHWRTKEAYTGYLPTLKGSIDYLLDKKYMLLDMNMGGGLVTIPQVTPTTIYSLQALLPLFDGFASTNRYHMASSLEDAAQDELSWSKFLTERQTVLQFYRALAAETLKSVAEQNLKVLQDHLKNVQATKKAGITTRYDVLRAEVQSSEAQSELLNTEDNLQIALLKLAEIMGKDSESRKPTGKIPELDASIIADLKESTNDRVDMRALKNRTDASQYNAQIQNRYWIPKIALFGGYQYYNNQNDRFIDNDSFREAYQVGLNLTWNLFDGLASTAKSFQADAQAIQATKNLQIAQLKAKQDFAFWKRKYLYYCSIYRSRQNDIQRSSEAVRLATEGHKAGVRTNSDLLDAEADWYRSRAGQVNAQLGAIEALINLELASGKRLYNFN